MKTYFRDFADFITAAMFVERRSNLGHNVRLMKDETKDENTFRVYFSAVRLDRVHAVRATEEKS